MAIFKNGASLNMSAFIILRSGLAQTSDVRPLARGMSPGVIYRDGLVLSNVP